MAGEEFTVVQRCAGCWTEIETFEVKKENMILSIKELSWCPTCKSDKPQIREIQGRAEAITEEQASYPSNAAIIEE